MSGAARSSSYATPKFVEGEGSIPGTWCRAVTAARAETMVLRRRLREERDTV